MQKEGIAEDQAAHCGYGKGKDWVEVLKMDEVKTNWWTTEHEKTCHNCSNYGYSKCPYYPEEPQVKTCDRHNGVV